MENVRNRRDITLVVTEEKRKLLTSQRNFEHSKKFSENFEAIEMRKSYVFMNKRISGWEAILDKTKELIDIFWYIQRKS